MMNKRKTKETETFVLQYDEVLEQFIEKSIEIANEKMPIIEKLFNFDKNKIGKIKASFFTKREDFVSYIQSLTNGHTPPVWASGCFYNNEIQTLLDVNNPKKMAYKTHTLIHEYIHLVIDNEIYQKYNIPRIRWFDESFANYLDGSQDQYTKQEFATLYNRVKDIKDFDLSILNDINKVTSDSYNGYDMFIVVGRYIFENKLEKEMLNSFSKSDETVKALGKTILAESLEYLEKKYSL
ncbi:MAG: hypothetical protein IJ817_00110 [Clostridia bacterium]|nr:hypothetical protein [Clostridia bacterium]